MRALVVGYGSIGSRHARILKELGCSVAVVSRRRIDFSRNYPDLGEAMADFEPEYVVVANSTSEHYRCVLELARMGFRGMVLVEKPLFNAHQILDAIPFRGLYVGYNLRFHPVLQRLRELMKSSGRILQAQVYVGQYLPDWRPDRTDYAASANQAAGGGVLRDLSHELDYLLWMFGPWQSLTALGGHASPLAIDTEDTVSLMMSMNKCPVVSLQMNYLDRVARREITMNFEAHTVRADLIQGTLSLNHKRETYTVKRDDTYRFQHEAVLNQQSKDLCTYEEGLEVMKVIKAAEAAMEKKVWVHPQREFARSAGAAAPKA